MTAQPMELDVDEPARGIYIGLSPGMVRWYAYRFEDIEPMRATLRRAWRSAWNSGSAHRPL